jgi:hypothetical protein
VENDKNGSPVSSERQTAFDTVVKVGGFLVVVVTLLEKAPMALGALGLTAVVFAARWLRRN